MAGNDESKAKAARVEHVKRTRDLSPYIDPLGPVQDDDTVYTLFKALKVYRQERKMLRLETFEKSGLSRLRLMGEVRNLSQHSGHHWSFFIVGNPYRVDYWPSTDKWRHQSKTHKGAFKTMIIWIKRKYNRDTDKGK